MITSASPPCLPSSQTQRLTFPREMTLCALLSALCSIWSGSEGPLKRPSSTDRHAICKNNLFRYIDIKWISGSTESHKGSRGTHCKHNSRRLTSSPKPYAMFPSLGKAQQARKSQRSICRLDVPMRLIFPLWLIEDSRQCHSLGSVSLTHLISTNTTVQMLLFCCYH